MVFLATLLAFRKHKNRKSGCSPRSSIMISRASAFAVSKSDNFSNSADKHSFLEVGYKILDVFVLLKGI